MEIHIKIDPRLLQAVLFLTAHVLIQGYPFG